MKRCSPRLAAKQTVPAPDREVSNSRVTGGNSSVDTSDELQLQVLLHDTMQPALSLGREKSNHPFSVAAYPALSLAGSIPAIL